MFPIRVSFRGGGAFAPPWNLKLLDMSSTSVKPQEALVVSLGKHNDITDSKNRHL